MARESSRDDLAMRGVVIRTLQPSEWRAYKNVRLRALADSPDAFSTLHADANAQPDEHWASRLLALSRVMDRVFVVEREGQLYGLVWGRILASDVTTAHVYQMWVAPELRGLGLGRTLLERIIDWARRRGVVTFVLGVTYGNGPAYRLYESVGFRAVGELEPLRPNSELKAQTMKLEGAAVMAPIVTPERPDSVDARALIAELDDHLGGLYPAESRHGYSVDKLLAERVAFFVIRDGDVPAGCGGVKLVEGEYAELKRMYVRPRFRGKGLATLMLNHLTEYAQGRGIRLLRLETGIHQRAAIELYERAGFRRIAPFADYTDDPLNRCYEKRLP